MLRVGRVCMHRLGVKNSYTLEASFGGSTVGQRSGTHLGIADLENMGKQICDTLLDFFDPDPSKVIYCQNEIFARLRQAMKAKYGEDGMPADSALLHEMESDTSGSNSSSDEGLPAHLQQEDQVWNLIYRPSPLSCQPLKLPTCPLSCHFFGKF